MIFTTNVKIKIHYSLIIFIILSLFLGQLKYVLIFLTIVLLHEGGHIFALLLFKGELQKITLTVVGGIIDVNDYKLNNLQNLIVSLSGITINVLIILIIKNIYIDSAIKEVILSYNKLMIAFNLLPIYPLDGFRIIEVFLNMVFDYEYAQDLSTIISSFFLILICMYGMISKSGAIIIISIFLFLKMLERRKVLKFSRIRHNAYNIALIRRLNR
jgi:stage IV sporulation protein FB